MLCYSLNFIYVHLHHCMETISFIFCMPCS
ncbi:hypothetical protein NC652_019602 [Populus alba x Populus x berolinensis]|nr:hypothetical protein NC652_019602 [Populus alba x Populus x berolinensis]